MLAALASTCLLALAATTAAAEGVQGAGSERLTWHRLPPARRPVAAADALLLSPEPERYSGYFRLNRTYDAHMFFWFFQARTDPDTAPLTLWMTGGPGCAR